MMKHYFSIMSTVVRLIALPYLYKHKGVLRSLKFWNRGKDGSLTNFLNLT